MMEALEDKTNTGMGLIVDVAEAESWSLWLWRRVFQNGRYKTGQAEGWMHLCDGGCWRRARE